MDYQTNLDPQCGFDYNLYLAANPNVMLGRFTSLTIHKRDEDLIFVLKRGLVDDRVLQEVRVESQWPLLLLQFDKDEDRFTLEPSQEDYKEGVKAGRSRIINRIQGIIRTTNEADTLKIIEAHYASIFSRQSNS